MPNAEDYVDGIINLRDNIIPIIDIRKMFHFDILADNKNCKIIIVTLNGKLIGLKVDEVSEVLRINNNDIEKKVDNNFMIKKQYIYGIAKGVDKLTIILNIKKIFESENFVGLQENV